VLKEKDVMDRQFLEFWGNFLINAAKGQKQMEDMSKWMQQGFKGFDELTGMFKKFYGLEHMEKDTPAYMETWKQASENFQKSYKDYLRMMGIVPKDEHLELVRKYEELKKKVAVHEETIKHLRILLEEKRAETQGEFVKGFREILEKQGEQFQETMETMGSFFKKDKNKL
jgi:tetratricopeptide (TPR) repeat protein